MRATGVPQYMMAGVTMECVSVILSIVIDNESKEAFYRKQLRLRTNCINCLTALSPTNIFIVYLLEFNRSIHLALDVANYTTI
jgi:hypothetical protein